ncbi:glycan biosynthesis hexose transferase WsfD [Bordetella genomosp. 13]|uniref:Glycosyltransferase RgtA/B/C/D-like domain-containing protein n=1 Tax=Bordetella genomosp. 13 TaxID=463040 RepID=A0A1W6Z7U9_9BORD|nr:hypothetical protein [Bordetella genomosp. 13]ARP92904.1 hypothetical protein CAL15_00025 [Bordetella genomosp. 13]
MRKYLGPRSIQLAALFLSALVLLVVNREFGVADNGDFNRYVGGIASTPLDLGPAQSSDPAEVQKYRFFGQPLFYWNATVDPNQTPWFSSATLLWKAGQILNGYLYSQEVVNLKNIGLPFFLLHLFSLVYVLRRIGPSHAGTTVAFLGTLLVLTDARITAFYNSLYAESVVILAILFVFAYFAGRLFAAPTAVNGRGEQLVFSALVLLLLVASVFAKRQYIYFSVPAFLFVIHAICVDVKLSRRVGAVVAFGFAAALAAAIVFLTVTQRADNPGEAFAARYTSYHALYYGLLPHSSEPLKLLEHLGLPPDSSELIGRSAWNEASAKLIAAEPRINLGTFLSAIVADPAAFAGSLLHNAREVGSYEMNLGMVHGTVLQYPPALISSISSLSTILPGLLLFCSAIVVSLILLVRPIGETAEKRFSSRIFIATLLTVLLSDVGISTFDGQQEAAKHVLIASISAVLILITGISSVAGRLSRRHLFTRPS